MSALVMSRFYYEFHVEKRDLLPETRPKMSGKIRSSGFTGAAAAAAAATATVCSRERGKRVESVSCFSFVLFSLLLLPACLAVGEQDDLPKITVMQWQTCLRRRTS